jgi:hypothetical protein
MFYLLLHVLASISIGHDAYRRGRSFIGWTLATFFVSILITWPLLLLLPRRNIALPAAEEPIQIAP